MKIIISGGGTGGHIFPAVAIANEVRRRYPDAEILFVGANGRMEMTRVPEAGYNIVGRIAGKPGGAMWLMIIVICLSQYVLRRFYPEETHGLTNDWAYFVENILLFWFGYVLVSRREYWQVLADQRRIFGAATLVFTVILYGMRMQFTDDEIDRLFWIDFTYFTNSLCLMVASVLMTVGYGYTYLNKNHRWLPRLNAAVYPFYILHQTVIVLLGYYVLTRTTIGVYPGFLVISFTTLFICAALYWLVIRPFRLLRLFFGVK